MSPRIKKIVHFYVLAPIWKSFGEGFNGLKKLILVQFYFKKICTIWYNIFSIIHVSLDHLNDVKDWDISLFLRGDQEDHLNLKIITTLKVIFDIIFCLYGLEFVIEKTFWNS